MTQGGRMEKTMSDILEIVLFLKDNSVTRDEFYSEINKIHNELNNKIDSVRNELNNKIDSVRNELNNKIDSVRNDMINHVDGFVKKHLDHEAEIAALGAKFERVMEVVTPAA